MLVAIDRVQLAVPDRSEAAAGWVALLGAEHETDDQLEVLGALRSRYRVGDGWIEFLEPDGTGPVASAVREQGPHLFAAGVSARDLGSVAEQLALGDAQGLLESGQLHLGPDQTGVPGLRLVISDHDPQPPVGAIDHLYEVTHLASDSNTATQNFAKAFNLDTNTFVAIDSKHYGYQGALTLFDSEQLDRLEMITPRVPDNTMGRFFARRGDCFYMAFAECGQLAAIEERALERGSDFTAVPPRDKRSADEIHTIFLHPSATGGMMLGLSRRTFAWSWSGQPERVEDRQ